MQKNVRLSGPGAELLRALKYDLDASDGDVVARSLEQTALERLRYHAAQHHRGASHLRSPCARRRHRMLAVRGANQGRHNRRPVLRTAYIPRILVPISVEFRWRGTGQDDGNGSTPSRSRTSCCAGASTGSKV